MLPSSSLHTRACLHSLASSGFAAQSPLSKPPLRQFASDKMQFYKATRCILYIVSCAQVGRSILLAQQARLVRSQLYICTSGEVPSGCIELCLNELVKTVSPSNHGIDSTIGSTYVCLYKGKAILQLKLTVCECHTNLAPHLPKLAAHTAQLRCVSFNQSAVTGR